MKPVPLMKIFKYIMVPLYSNLSSCRLRSEREVRSQREGGSKGFLKLTFSRSMTVIFENKHVLMHVNNS